MSSGLTFAAGDLENACLRYLLEVLALWLQLCFKFQAEAFSKSGSEILSWFPGPAFFKYDTNVKTLIFRVKQRSLPTHAKSREQIELVQASSVEAFLCASGCYKAVVFYDNGELRKSHFIIEAAAGLR